MTYSVSFLRFTPVTEVWIQLGRIIFCRWCGLLSNFFYLLLPLIQKWAITTTTTTTVLWPSIWDNPVPVVWNWQQNSNHFYVVLWLTNGGSLVYLVALSIGPSVLIRHINHGHLCCWKRVSEVFFNFFNICHIHVQQVPACIHIGKRDWCTVKCWSNRWLRCCWHGVFPTDQAHVIGMVHIPSVHLLTRKHTVTGWIQNWSHTCLAAYCSFLTSKTRSLAVAEGLREHNVSWNVVKCCTNVSWNALEKACNKGMTFKVIQGY